MIEKIDLLKLCEKCNHFKDDIDYGQTICGCSFVYPLRDCPYIEETLKLILDWRNSMWHNGANGGKRCAGELVDIFRVK